MGERYLQIVPLPFAEVPEAADRLARVGADRCAIGAVPGWYLRMRSRRWTPVHESSPAAMTSRLYGAGWCRDPGNALKSGHHEAGSCLLLTGVILAAGAALLADCARRARASGGARSGAPSRGPCRRAPMAARSACSTTSALPG